MKRIAIFASGSGTNAQNIINFFIDDSQAEVSLLLSNNANAFALQRAKALGVETVVFNKEQLLSPSGVLKTLQKFSIDFIVLAGFLWKIPKILIDPFGGKIVNIGSMHSIFASPVGSAYAASKGGVVQLTKSLANAWAKDNIQVNAILPGYIDTEMTRKARKDIPELQKRVEERTPVGHWGKPEHLGGTAVFLSSKASDFVTGASIPVDGGYSING